MTQEEIRDWLVSEGYEETILFENPDFANAVIGVSTDGQLVYSYDLMVEHLMCEDGMTAEDAAEFIAYNTIRALPYMGEYAPIIVRPI